MLIYSFTDSEVLHVLVFCVQHVGKKHEFSEQSSEMLLAFTSDNI